MQGHCPGDDNREPMKRVLTILTTVLVASGILYLGGCHPTIIGPTAPSGYQIVLPEASQTRRWQPLNLTVWVRDTAGQPADDVEVHFHIPPQWSTQAVIEPPRVVTLEGKAVATFRARTLGNMAVEIRVEDRTETVPIVVVGDTPRF